LSSSDIIDENEVYSFLSESLGCVVSRMIDRLVSDKSVQEADGPLARLMAGLVEKNQDSSSFEGALTTLSEKPL
jgi:hypothetical protein